MDTSASLAPGDDSAFVLSGGPVAVLLVEDETAHVRIAQRAFESDKDAFHLTCVGTVAAARAALSSQRPSLVIADVKLPDGLGTDLIPPSDSHEYGVVIMTAQGDEATAVEALKRGALDYVVKSAETLVGLPDVARRAVRVWRHIDARRLAEAELREEERRLRAVLDAIPDLIFIVSHDGVILDSRGGTKTYASQVRGSYVGKSIRDLIDSEQSAAFLAMVHDVLRTTERRMGLFYVPVEGNSVVVDVRLAPYDKTSVVAICRNITDEYRVGTRLEALSDREREVLRLVAAGVSNKQVAAKLDLSIKTVEAHRSRLMKKLGARNMAELMQLAMAVKDRL